MERFPPDSLADLDLVHQVLSGDHEAFGELFRAHNRDVYRTARAITDSHPTSLDVVQEVFLKVHQRIGTWRGRASLKTWILRIAVRCALDHRRRGRRLEPLGEMTMIVDPRADLDRRLLVDRVHQLAADVRGRPGVVLQLRLLGGLSNREIADSLGLSEANVRVQLSKAIRQLRELL